MSQSSLKRKQQPTISNFFTKSSPTGPTDGVPQKKQNGGVTKNTHVPSTSTSPPSPENADEDDEEDEIVRPSRKRVRSNGLDSTVTRRSSDRDGDGDEPTPAPDTTTTKSPTQADRSPTSSSRTQRFRFQSSPAQVLEEVADSEQQKDAEQLERERRGKAHLHQKFVRRLGGPDCLPSLEHGGEADGDAGAESEGGVDEDEGAAPSLPSSKGKGAKKAGPAKLTPMEKQVINIKKKHMDTVLIVEVGYKFRFFGEDARVAARELSIVCIPGKLRFDERKCSFFFFSPVYRDLSPCMLILALLRSLRSPSVAICISQYSRAQVTCTCEATRLSRL